MNRSFAAAWLFFFFSQAAWAQVYTDIRHDFLSEARTAEDIARSSLERIHALDDRYNAVLALNEESVLSQARRLDTLSRDRREQLSLAALPILIKDNIETSEYPTTAGSLALAENSGGRDAALVEQLRKAGAIIMGKTNLSEWANFRSEYSISGWSAVGGQTRNATDDLRSPCGSSSGSAVAVALDYVPVAIGTETDGSVVCPASVNGIVGFKPTHGLVSGSGIVPLALSQDTAGTLAKSVDDASRVLSVMIDQKNDSTKALALELAHVRRQTDLSGIRIGLLTHTLGYDKRRDALFYQSVEMLEMLGAEIVPGLAFTPPESFWQMSYDVLLYEFKRDLNAYLGGLGESGHEGSRIPKTLAEVIRFNEANQETELRYFDQSIFIKSEQMAMTEQEYQAALSNIRTVTRDEGLDALLNEYDLDALISITVGPAWMIDSVNGDAFFGPGISSYPAIGGHPHITVPMGKIENLPVGLSFIGARYADAELAAIAATYQGKGSGFYSGEPED